MNEILSYNLAKLTRLIPGYDPWATAGDCGFDEEAAEFALAFFTECLQFSKGARAGQPFELEPWQQAIVANLWGWKRPDGTRRYREALIMVPRKNGKTEMAAGLVCLVLYTDAEAGAECYSAAAEREQARLVFTAVKTMICRDPELMGRAQLYQHSIVVGDASYKALSADAHTKHGLSPHLVIVDELHAQPNRELVDTLTTGQGARTQPLLIHITTSDYEREGSICNEKHDYGCKVRDGVFEDRSFLPVIYEAAKDCDWKDPQVWRQCNPNLGVSLSQDYLERECRRAEETPAYENTFKRLHLNIRTEQASRWMPMDAWDACGGAVDRGALNGQPCYGGLDLATVSDMAAFVLAFEVDGDYQLLAWYWCPEETAERRERRQRQPYLTWARQGLLELTPGNSTDYRQIRQRLGELAREFSIQEIAFDPWNATHLATELGEEDGLPMVEHRQGTISMNEPMKTLLRLVHAKRVQHGGNAILRWNAANIVVRTDASANLRPDKEKSTEKIDGMVAAVMAVGRATRHGGGGSVYEDRGLLEL